VNATGHEGGVVQMAGYADLPLFQDTVAADAWTTWGAGYRDVVLLDEENRIIGVYNLSTHNLGNEDNYAELRDLLTGAVAP
jgi:hypothetical protein